MLDMNGKDQTREERAQVIIGSVKEEFNRDEPHGPFIEPPPDGLLVFNQPDFIRRVCQVGRRLYLAMLDNGGLEPGKTDCIKAAANYIEGMSEDTKAMFYICCYEALCDASFEFRLRGKMNAKLRAAANNPKSIPGADQG